jgi:hypothetical protein
VPVKKWIQNVFIIFVLIGILGLSVEMVSFRYWVTARQEVSRMYENWPGQGLGAVTEQDLAGLPGSLQHWLREAGVIGRSHSVSVRSRMQFTMVWQLRERWRDGISHIYVNTMEPGFVWMGTSKELPFVRLCGKRVFLSGREEETYPILSMGRARILKGEKLRQRMLAEYLSFLPWIPAAALKPYLDWEGLPDGRVRAIIHREELTIEGIFVFREDGLPDTFQLTVPVYEDGVYVDKTLKVSYGLYTLEAGFQIPRQLTYSWLDGDSETVWMVFQQSDTDYNTRVLFNSF